MDVSRALHCVGTPLSLVRYIMRFKKCGFLYNVRFLVVYLSRRRGKERFCYSSTLVYISSVVLFPDVATKFVSRPRLISCVVVYFFFFGCIFLFFSQFIEWSYNVSKNSASSRLHPSNKFQFYIRKNDNIVVYNVTVNDTFSVAKETRMFDLIPTQYAKCPTMLNAHCCFVVVVCFVLFWWFGGCTIGYFFYSLII